jgi:hypothetical protein
MEKSLWRAQFLAGYGLDAASPCLELRPNPQDYAGEPVVNLSRGPRLRDHNGDGLAEMDAGAFERENPTLTPPTCRA